MSVRPAAVPVGIGVACAALFGSALPAHAAAAEVSTHSAAPAPSAPVPASAESLRVASFASGLSRSAPGELVHALSGPGDDQGRQVAETVQRVRPDVLLLSDVDVDSGDEAARSFRTNYLAVGVNGQRGIDYPYVYTAEVNSGVETGADLDDDGEVGGAGDAYGPGAFPGQGGMVLFSRYPLESDGIRTFQQLKWSEMPGHRIPVEEFTDLEQSVLRLSSTSHWDVPVRVGDRTIHVLASDPADARRDPAGQERNHDEIRFWADYISGEGARSDYIVDDEGGTGGVAEDREFVLLGSLGADLRGGAGPEALSRLLDSRQLTDTSPDSAGARAVDGATAHDTQVATVPGQQVETARMDYVLPSEGLEAEQSGVFWPSPGQAGDHLVGPHGLGAGPVASLVNALAPSDHRLVWVDLDTSTD